MTLASGARLGPYVIDAPLGAGGMGEVFRARDTRLNRDVALKMLPASYASDAERLRRFEQEAQAAGALNHPGITAVYDVGSHDGAPYLVTELLEGETLRARLSGGALPPRKAVDFAVQIAKALAAAHQKGIVHRDLKPENLFVTSDGRMKILDFGLAKLTQTEPMPGVLTNLPTASATEPGVVMGTLGYMSPEQVKGKPADARSDIFAFGAVLYEMLSGLRAFQRESAAETMSAILREDPPDLSATNRGVPPGLERIVRHCLEKSPDERAHSAHDLAFDLESFSLASGAAPAPASRAVSRRALERVAVGVVILGVGLAAGALLFRRPSAGVPRFHRLTFQRGNVLRARFASDGRTVVYGAAWGGKPSEIYTVRTESPESRALGIPNATVASVSSAGDLAVLSSESMMDNRSWATLSRVPLSGGAPRPLLEEVSDADFTPDGKELAVVRNREGAGRRLELPPGKVLWETPNAIGSIRVSRDGALVAFLENGPDGTTLRVVDRAGRVRSILGPHAVFTDRFAWSASGREILFYGGSDRRDAALRAVDLSGRVRTLYRSTGFLFVHDVFPDGRLLVEQAAAARGIMFGRTSGKDEVELSWFDRSDVRAVSPGGTAILFNEVGEAVEKQAQAYFRKTDGSPPIRLADGVALDLSPDGTRVLLKSEDGLFAVPVGAGTPVKIEVAPIETFWEAAYAGDGERIVLNASEKGRQPRVWILDPPAAPRPVTPEGTRAGTKIVSPDGRWVVCWSGYTSRLSLLPLDGGTMRPLAGTEHEDPLGWTADGRSLYVRPSPGLRREIFTLDVTTLEQKPWRVLEPPDVASVVYIPSVRFARDGSAYAYTFHRVLTSDLYVVEGLR